MGRSRTARSMRCAQQPHSSSTVTLNAQLTGTAVRKGSASARGRTRAMIGWSIGITLPGQRACVPKFRAASTPLRHYRAIHAAPKHPHRHTAVPPQGFPDGLAPARNGSISAHNCGLNPTPPPCYRMPCPRTDTAHNLVNINRIPTPRRLDFFLNSALPMSRARASAQRRADTSQGAPSTWLSSVR